MTTILACHDVQPLPPCPPGGYVEVTNTASAAALPYLQVELIAFINSQWQSRWISGSITDDVGRVEMQMDGNLVAKHVGGAPYWDTKSGGQGSCDPYKLELRDDCVVVIRDCLGNKVWSTGDPVDFGYGYNRPIYQPEPLPGPGTCSPIPACQGASCPAPPPCSDLDTKDLCLSVDTCCWWVLLP
jgi:hypothetical protein